jgi:hypothetical protein
MLAPNHPDPARANLDRIQAPVMGVSGEPDADTAKELDNQQREAEIHGLKQDIDERKKYASRFFWLSCGWLLVITTILMLQGFGSIWFWRVPFKLPENVLLAVIGSTTVLGILYVVANYLFPKRGK